MSGIMLSIGGAMFGIPLVGMVGIAILLGEVPGPMLFVGGWSMALGVITAGIGAVFSIIGG